MNIERESLGRESGVGQRSGGVGEGTEEGKKWSHSGARREGRDVGERVGKGEKKYDEIFDGEKYEVMEWREQ